MPVATAALFGEIKLNRLCKGNPEDREEGYTALLPNPPTIPEMQARFQSLRHRYETALAKEKLEKKIPGNSSPQGQ